MTMIFKKQFTPLLSLRLIPDDTSLIATGKDPDLLLQRINSDHSQVLSFEWLCTNYLNLKKTKILGFATTTKRYNFNLYPPLKLEDQ